MYSNRRTNTKAILLIFLLFAINWKVNAQRGISESDIVKKVNSYTQQYELESCYLSFDKPSYFSGDTIRFKAFVMSRDLEMSTLSEKLHIELLNDSAEVIDKIVIVVANGLGYGSLALYPNIKDGRYTIRAYTNWQQNLGKEYFFQKSIYIGSIREGSWAINSKQTLLTVAGERKLKIDMQFSDLSGQPQGYKDLSVELLEGNKRLRQANLRTTLEGHLLAQLPMPSQRSKNEYLLRFVELPSKKVRALIPVIAIDSTSIDLQFMPEGGKMVNGLNGRVGFKGVGSDGRGVNLKGEIVDQNGLKVADFSAGHKGMGSFRFTPLKDQTYSANFNYNGQTVKVNLPAALAQGTLLKVDHLSAKDSVTISIRVSPELPISPFYELLAMNAEKVSFALKIGLEQRFANLKLAKDIFPKGVIHFALITAEGLVLNERQAVVNENEKINVELKHLVPLNSSDSVQLELLASDAQNRPISASFSLSITNDEQVSSNKNASNIMSYHYLEKNLSGFLEDPGWYFETKDNGKALAIDNLLLTQGWIGYSWDKVLAAKKPDILFKPEKLGIISGSITGLFNKPKNNIKLTLLSLGKDVFVMDTVTNELGKYLFKNVPVIDSPEFAIKIKTLKDRTSASKIDIDGFMPSKDMLIPQKYEQPWFINTDSTLRKSQRLAATRNSNFDRLSIKPGENLLKEVEIKAVRKEIIQNVGWDASMVMEIDSAALQKMPSTTLMLLLKKMAPGFRVGRYWNPDCGEKPKNHTSDSFVIGSSLISSVRVDKINTAIAAGEAMSIRNAMELSGQGIFDINNYIFNYLTSKDITNITIYKGCAFHYIEITTRSGKGPWLGKTTGMAAYRPAPLQFGSFEYKPKYLPSVTEGDVRSTAYWNANVTTLENGKATITFYPGPANKNYSYRLEGTDLNGRFGYKTISSKELPLN